MLTNAGGVHSLGFFQHAIHHFHLGQAGLLQASIFTDDGRDLVSQWLNVLWVGCQVVHDIREEIRCRVNRRQRKADLGHSEV